MIYTTTYQAPAPIGTLFLASKNGKLIGLWMEGRSYDLGDAKFIKEKPEEEVLVKTKNWLNQYFRGEKPSIQELHLAPKGTPFQHAVWKMLCEIPYGETITYGELANKMAQMTHQAKMSPQAIGGAVGHNPILIVIPCHRVIGANGSLTGYAGGISKKEYLLAFEKGGKKGSLFKTKELIK